MTHPKDGDPDRFDERAGERSWEEFLREVRGPESESSEDAAAAGTPEDSGAREPLEEPVEDPPGSEPPPEPPTPASRPARVVVPPESEEFEGVRKRRRLLLRGAAAALALLAGGYLVLDRIDVGGDGDVTVEAREAGVERAAGANGAAADTAPGGEDAPSEADAARIAARADSVSGAVEDFRERLGDFRLERIGCEGLRRGIRGVRTAFAELERVAGEEATVPEGPEGERYARLAADVEAAERAFSESGCSDLP